jgi:hypothetical protein
VNGNAATLHRRISNQKLYVTTISVPLFKLQCDPARREGQRVTSCRLKFSRMAALMHLKSHPADLSNTCDVDFEAIETSPYKAIDVAKKNVLMADYWRHVT